MNKAAVIISLLLVLFSCTGGKDVIAVFDTGKIERAELRDWSLARRMNPAEYRTNPDMEKQMLRQIAVEKIVFNMASAEGFENDPVCARVKDAVYRNFLVSYYNSRHYEKINFNERCADVSIIRLYFKDRVNGEDYKKKSDIMKNIILPELKKGRPFGDVASAFSTDASKSKKGSLGFLLPDMLDKEMRTAVISLPPGDYTRMPFVMGNSLCIIRVNEVAEITDININDIVKDKSNRSRILSYIKYRAINSSIETLKSCENIVSKLDKAGYASDDEFLFSVDDVSYTVRDIKNILNIFYMLKTNEVKNDFSVKEMKFTAEKIFVETVTAAAAEKDGYNKKKEFLDKWQYLERATITGIYKSRYLTDKIKVTDEEVEATYKASLKNTDRSKAVRSAVYSRLYRNRFRKTKSEWEEKLLKEHRFVID